MADLSALRDAGIDIETVPADQRAALESLTDDEVATLASIRSKLNSGGEDEARSQLADTGNIVW